MIFKRNITSKLLSWKNDKSKKPLVIMGARQVGKTTVINEFGKDHYRDVHYFNFELNPELHEFFKINKSPERILSDLSLFTNKHIDITASLIVFDEIQACPDALTSLKYFEESNNKYNLIAAGSLLGVTLGQERSFPVGKVEFLDLYPLTFEEFLSNADDRLYQAYCHYIDQSKIVKIPTAFFEPLLATFKKYLICGGMPEAASHFVLNNSVNELQKIQDAILRSYQLDFAKYTSPVTANRIQYIWNSIPSQLAKENKKFIYKAVKKGARAREYESSITWLTQAGIIHQIYNVNNPSIPLQAYRDLSAFKIYMLDVGLLMRKSKLNPSTLITGHDLFKEFKGTLIENYVAQSLTNSIGYEPCYWTSDRSAEIDYIIEHNNKVIPIEVKSGRSTRAKSLSEYDKKYKPEIKIRISPLNLQLDNSLINIPIFYTDKVFKIIDKILDNHQ